MAAALEIEPGERVVSLPAAAAATEPPRAGPAARLDDVLEGWVSRESAAGVYGVVLREADGDGLEIDEQATERLRGEAAAPAS